MKRRAILKLATGFASSLVWGRLRRASAAWPAAGTLAINPNISDSVVVACSDLSMLKVTPETFTFDGENPAVDPDRVAANLDAMAIELTGVASPDSAWNAIFRSSKPWASTLVAIKVDALEPKNMPRVAVLQKLCSVLGRLGVPPANIIIYDGNMSGSGLASYAPYFSLIDASKVQAVISNYNDSLGGTANATLPDGSSTTCTADIATGKVDILINVATNKGSANYGGCDLCLENNLGSFAADPDNLTTHLSNVNKSDAILGGNPLRQQLCIIDSLFANRMASTGTPEAMPGYLIMGTCAPVVDYLTVKKLREEVMFCTHDDATVDSLLTAFGFMTTDPQWIVVPPAGTSSMGGAGAGSGGASAGISSGIAGQSGVGGLGGATTTPGGGAPTSGGASGNAAGTGGAGAHGGAAGFGGHGTTRGGCAMREHGRDDGPGAMLVTGGLIVARLKRLKSRVATIYPASDRAPTRVASKRAGEPE